MNNEAIIPLGMAHSRWVSGRLRFNVGSLNELNRIESLLRDRDLFTSRGQIEDGTSELLLGRDPDNSPLVFVCYAEDKTPGPDYYRSVGSLVYSQDA